MGAKLMFIVYRRADITHEQCLERWGDRQHLSFVEKTPDLIRHSHNETMQLLSGTGPDGIGELWYPSEAAMHAALASPEFAAAFEDGKRFADMEKSYAIVVREQWMIDAQQRAIEKWAASWSGHDMSSVLPLFTDDVLFEDVTMGVVNHGHAELRAFGEGFFNGFPDVTFELQSSFSNGSIGGAEWVMRGTHTGDLPGMPATGKRMQVRGASTFEFEGEKMRRCSDYWDMATFLKQLGLMASAAV